MLAKIDRFAVHADRCLAHRDKVQTGRSDDDIGFNMLAGLQLNARLGEVVDMVGHHLGLALGYGGKHVTVWNQAQTLLPWAIFGDKMRININRSRQRLAGHIDQLFTQLRWIAARIPICEPLHVDIAPARQRISQLFRQDFADKFGEWVDCRTRDHIGRRALKHRYLRTLLRHYWHNRHRGGA